MKPSWCGLPACLSICIIGATLTVSHTRTASTILLSLILLLLLYLQVCQAMVHMADFPAFWTAIAEDGFYEEVIFCYSPSLHSPSPLPPFDSVGRVAVIMTVHIFPFLCTACPPSHILQLPPSVSYCTSIASHRIISDLHAMLRCSAHAHAHAHNGPLGSTSEESLGHCVEARFNQPARSCNDADACWESECAWGQSAEHGQPNCRCPGELLRCHPLLPHEVSKSETSAALGDIEPSREREWAHVIMRHWEKL